VIASRVEQAARRHLETGWFGLALLVFLSVGMGTACRTPAGAPLGSAFDHGSRAQPPPPDAADRTAVSLARSALLSNPQELASALARLESIETVLASFDEKPTGLIPVAIDLRNTTLDDSTAYRRATKRLLERQDLQPAMRSRLELYWHDAPLELAHDRIVDAWQVDFGMAFNALAEPIGRSIMTAELAPMRLGRALINYATWIYTREALDIHRRQALAHWKEYVARHPDAEESTTLLPRIRNAEARWRATQYDRAMRVARRAWKADKVRLTLIYSDRALRHAPEAQEASQLRRAADERLRELRKRQELSVSSGDIELSSLHPDESRALALALLLPDGDITGAAKRLYAVDPNGPLADEARFAATIPLGEAGDYDEMWNQLEDIAKQDPETHSMARHAAALVNDPRIHTWEAFRQARRQSRWDRVKWVFMGPFYRGARDRGLPRPLEWVLQAPALAEVMMGTPFRLINVPWARSLPSSRLAAVRARRHLKRHPRDDHSEDVRDWLESYELYRGNYVAALQLMENSPNPELEKLAELREYAAGQMLSMALRESSLTGRLGMYRQVATVYSATRAARRAAELSRIESKFASAQHIQIAKSYLVENPEVAGRNGLGIRPTLLDDDASNGELHPEGIVLLGRRRIEVNYLAASGDPDDEPVRRVEQISEEHLARAVSQLEETSYQNFLLDPLDDVAPDALRDTYFERVRLGLTDGNGSAGLTGASFYKYVGVREKYGMVRTRESILPFDLVISGSLNTMALGAYPRIRRPRPTPNQFLFE